MQDHLSRLATSANALIAVGIALKARRDGAAPDPRLQARIDAILQALGFSDALDGVAPAQAAAMLANIRGDLRLGLQSLADTPVETRWSHDDTEILESFGEVSAGFPAVLEARIGPGPDDLLDRLDSPGARFLDVGVGVAALAMAMARHWPGLQVVGVDPWAPALAIARRKLRAAGLENRIELHEAGAETLGYSETFDLAWVPSAFIPRAVLPEVVARAGQALKPGGWLLLAAPHSAPDPLAVATAQFRTVLWGGNPLAPDEARELLEHTGLVEAQRPDLPPGAPIAVTAARRLR